MNQLRSIQDFANIESAKFFKRVYLPPLIILVLILGIFYSQFQIRRSLDVIQNLNPYLNQLVSIHDFIEINRQLQVLKNENILSNFQLENRQKIFLSSFKNFKNDLGFKIQDFKLVIRHTQNITIENFKLIYETSLSLVPVFISLIIILGIFIVNFKFVRNKFIKFSSTLTEPLLIVSQKIKSFKPNDSFTGIKELPLLEVQNLVDEFSSLYSRMRDFDHKMSQMEKHEEVAKVAAQVAHDIRSPLAAMEVVVNHISTQIDENLRLILTTATQRINDIANNLLQVKKASSQVKEVNLVNLISLIVSEKRIQLLPSDQIQIIFNPHEKSLCLFSNLIPQELKNIISNLINNSLEASFEDSPVEITVQPSENFNEIKIIDFGKGIPPQVLNRLFTESFSFEKTNGNGLGLFQAKSYLNSIGGHIFIDSQVGQGTQVRLLLPSISTPKWYLSKLKIHPQNLVAVVDDDISIHQIWKSRLSQIPSQNLFHFYDTESFLQWRKLVSNEFILTLIDYEFKHQSLNGLQILTDHLIPNAILVSSRTEDSQIQSICSKMNLKILPKSQAPIIPIEFL